jgi:ATP-dependent DNA ligase
MNKIYPKLYTKDTLSNIRIWYMEQNNEKYRTVSGLKDGEHVFSEWTVAESKNVGKKNATSAVEQATSEIEARYKKQRKTGYFDKIEDVGTFQYVEPMLAHPLKKVENKINYAIQRWLVQCKYNGNRCIATKNGLFTRKGETWMCVPHIQDSLIMFFKNHPDAVLDGELYNYELREKLNELSSLVKKKVHITPEDYAKSEQMVRYYVYDGYGFEGMDEETSYEKRKAWIDANVIGKYKYICEVKSYAVSNESQMMQYFEKFVKDGEEGVIMRLATSSYEHKRSNNLVKVKGDDDSEGTILSIGEGAGNWSGAAYTVEIEWEGKVFEAVFTGSYKQRAEILKNKAQWIGKKATFTYMKTTGKGVPNSARIDPNNCFSADR